MSITANTITVNNPAYKMSSDKVYGGSRHYYLITMSIQRWKSANYPDETTNYEYQTEENDSTVPSNAFQFYNHIGYIYNYTQGSYTKYTKVDGSNV